MKKTECIIDANFLAVYVYERYAIFRDGTPKFQEDKIAEGLKEIVNGKFSNATLNDFQKVFSSYNRYYTSPFIIHEVEHVLRKAFSTPILQQKFPASQTYFAPYEMFKQSAALFRADHNHIPHITDEHVHFVEIVDMPASALKFNNIEALREFKISDMSLIYLAQKFNHPILTWDKNLRDFIITHLYPDVALVDYSYEL